MDKSLRSNTDELTGTKAAIKMAMRSPAGVRMVWTIVEGEDDVRLYNRMLNEDTVTIKTSEGEDGRRGYKNVESIVAEISAEDRKAKIFGIRDRDYTSFEVPVHIFPENVFVTDRRDLEMMLLESKSVQTAMINWTADFTKAFEIALEVGVVLGQLRLCNHIYNFSIVFRDKIKHSRIWNQNMHNLDINWRQYCRSVLNGYVSDEEITAFINRYQLDDVSPYDLCRGHDVLTYLSLALVKLEYSVPSITSRLINSYSAEDFQSTNLYAEIREWQLKNNVKVLKTA